MQTWRSIEEIAAALVAVATHQPTAGALWLGTSSRGVRILRSAPIAQLIRLRSATNDSTGASSTTTSFRRAAGFVPAAS